MGRSRDGSSRSLKQQFTRYISTMGTSPPQGLDRALTSGEAFPLLFLTPTMSRRLFSNTLLRDISDVLRDVRVLTGPHHPSTSGTRTLSPDSLLHLPDVGEPVQYLIDMGIRPALSRRLSSVYMDTVSRYKQVFESYFHLATQESCHFHPEQYRDIFVVRFRGTIQELASRMVSTAWVWLCQAGLSQAFFRSQHIDVRISAVVTSDEIDISLVSGTYRCLRKGSYSFEIQP